MSLQVQDRKTCSSCPLFSLCLHNELKKLGITSGTATEAQIKPFAEREPCETYNKIKKAEARR